MKFEPIAVVGLGCILPEASGISEFLTNLRTAKYSIAEIDPARWDPEDYFCTERRAGKTYSKIGAWVDGFTFESHKYRIPPNVLRHIDIVQQWAITVCDQALLDAGCSHSGNGFDRSRCAVVMGNSMGGELRRDTDLWIDRARYERVAREAGISVGQARAFTERLVEGVVPISEDTMPGELPNIVAGRVAQALDLHGPNYVTDAACASALAAVLDGCMLLQGGYASWVVAGAADRSMDPVSFAKFSAVGALSADGSFPFDARASGFVMGEGAGAVVLRRMRDAIDDGDRIYAVIRAITGSSDGRGKGITAPNIRGQELVLRETYARAGYGPETIDLVEGHGTSTRVGDATEVTALARVFQDCPRPVLLGSVKGMIGHLKAAAGIAGLLKAVLALDRRQIFPSANFENPNPEIPWATIPFRVPIEAQPWPATNGRPARAAVSSFGFGGTNFHLTLERFEPDFHSSIASTEPASVPVPRLPEASPVARVTELDAEIREVEGGILCFRSATVGEAVSAARTACEKWLATSDDPADVGLRLSEVACEQLRRAGDGSVRLAVAATSWPQLRRQLDLLPQVEEPRKRDFLAVQGIFLNPGDAPQGKVAFLFPGQGSQYVGMLEDLGRRYQAIGDAWALADETLEPVLKQPLSRVVFPDPPASTAEALVAAELRLRATEYCQPAMLVTSLALLELYRQHGVEPDMVGGHSLGEYTALTAAGALPPRDALRAVVMRGTEMASLRAEDPGCMAAVIAPFSDVEEMIDSCSGYLVAANKNSPRMTVISGETPAVEAALARCRERGISATRIAVSHAFHSRIVAPADEPLLRFLDTMEFQPPRIPMTSNLDGGFYPEAGPDEVRQVMLERLGPQMSHPVEWTRQIRTMHRAGARIWVECGPKRALSTFNEDCLAGKPHVTILSNHPKQGGIATWLAALARLWTVGLPVTFPAPEDPIHTAGFRPPQKAVAPSTSEDPAETVLAAAAALSGYPRRLLTPTLRLEQDLRLDADRVGALLDHLGNLQAPVTTLADVIAAYRGGGAPEVKGQPAFRPPSPSPKAPDAGAPRRLEPARSQRRATEVETFIVEVLSDKSGYPSEVLEVDLDLEGDLGIDSIKQAEAVGEIYQHYGLELPENDGLRQLNTIAQVADAIASQLGDGEVPAPADAAAEAPAVRTATAAPEAQSSAGIRFWQAVSEPLPARSAPLAPRSGLVLLNDDGLGLAEAITERLRREGFDVEIVDAEDTPPKAPVVGFIHLAPAGLPETAAEPERLGEQTALAARRAFSILQAIEPSAFAVSVTCVDGGHGFLSRRRNPWSLGAHGVFKSLAHERPGLRVRCYDLKPTLKPATSARRLVKDLLEHDGPVEIGLAGRARCRWLYRPAEPGDGHRPPCADDVFLVSGGGSGITARCVIALAVELRGGRFALLGSTPLHPEAAELARLSEDELADRRRVLAESLSRAGERVTPVALERAWRPFVRSREVQSTLGAVAAAGGEAIYIACDIRNPEAVTEAVETCRRRLDSPTVVVHGAGIERSHLISDKRAEEFDLVHDTKVLGWKHLRAATHADPVRLSVSFTSVVGRFGNAGQSDYAAANGTLSAAAHQLRGDRRCRHLALAWTAWEEAGMAARGPVLERLRQAGIEPLAADAGAELFVRAMMSDLRGEVMIAGRLGVLDRWHSFPRPHLRPETCLVGEVLRSSPKQELLARRRLDRSQDLFLDDHTIDGHPYLAGVLSLEGFAEAARLLHPELICSGFEQVAFPLPVKLTGPGKDLELVAKTRNHRTAVCVECNWQSRPGKSPSAASQPPRIHVHGICRLQAEPERLGEAAVVRPGEPVLPSTEIYRRFFHGPRMQCHGGVLRLVDGALEGEVRRRLPSLLADLEPHFTVAPLVLEAAVQNAGLLAMIQHSVVALPTAIYSVRLRDSPTDVDLFVRSRLTAARGRKLSFDCQVLDTDGSLYVVIEGLELTTRTDLPKALHITL